MDTVSGASSEGGALSHSACPRRYAQFHFGQNSRLDVVPCDPFSVSPSSPCAPFPPLGPSRTLPLSRPHNSFRLPSARRSPRGSTSLGPCRRSFVLVSQVHFLSSCPVSLTLHTYSGTPSLSPSSARSNVLYLSSSPNLKLYFYVPLFYRAVLQYLSVIPNLQGSPFLSHLIEGVEWCQANARTLSSSFPINYFS